MYEAELTPKSLSNQAAFCWLTWWIHVTNLIPLQNLCGEIFRPHVKILIVWIPIEMKNSPNNCKTDSALPAKVNQ